MIDELTVTLKKVLQESSNSPKLRNADIVFAPPTENLTRQKLTISIFLYDIRENLELRSNDTIREFKNEKYQLTYPSKYIDCSYLITAWSVQESELSFLEEQNLLGQVLQVLSRHPYLKEEYLPESLKKQKISVTISHLDSLKTTGEFWSALGGKLRPSISVTLTVSLEDVLEGKEVKLVTESPKVDFSKPREICGKVTDQSDPAKPIFKATVSLTAVVNGSFEESRLTTTTDNKGRYSFSNIIGGKYILKAEVKTNSGVVSSEEQEIDVPKTDESEFNEQINRDLEINLVP